ncbi:DUF3054 domain-containing protein [Kytococcus sp. Marseille-QA3725]
MTRSARPDAPSRTTFHSRVPVWVAALLDAGSIALFAGLGRRSHDTGSVLTGVPETAWPFWVGGVLGWVASAAVRRRVPSGLGNGLVVLVATVLLGMALRQLTGQGTAWSFVMVTTIVLGVLLLGWRAVAGLLTRR